MINALARLNQIITVARLGSITRAAEVLNITQPALSRSVASFEAYHGIKVFHRSKSGVSVTHLGAQLIKQAHRVLDEMENLNHNLKLYAGGEAGRIAIGLGPLLACILLPGLSKGLLQQGTRVELSSQVAPINELTDQLFDDRIELILGNEQQVTLIDNVSTIPIGAMDIGLYVRAEHPLATSKNIPFAEIDSSWPAASATPFRVSQHSGAGGGIICSNYYVLKEAVLATDCIWSTSSRFVEEEVKSGKIVKLDVLNEEMTYVKLSAGFREGRELSPLAKRIVEEAKNILSLA